ncbi:hypothetical protein Ae201684P_006804 [Aphanomyces euteiches]|nr:hypothetical protein Ae201684P_006804 [Aphanomyces euteiches]
MRCCLAVLAFVALVLELAIMTPKIQNESPLQTSFEPRWTQDNEEKEDPNAEKKKTTTPSRHWGLLFLRCLASSESHPLLAKCITNGTVFGLGDVIAQSLADASDDVFSWRRVALTSFYVLRFKDQYCMYGLGVSSE